MFIFLVAESEVAVERLIDRRTESQEELLVKVATAREEVRHVKNFDCIVVNAKGRLDDAVKRVECIIDAEKSKVNQSIVRILCCVYIIIDSNVKFCYYLRKNKSIFTVYMDRYCIILTI